MTQTPPGWRTTTLGELGRYLNGRAFKKAEWSTTGRPIIRIQNLTGSSDVVNRFQGDVEDRYVIRPGDLLVSWAATLGAYIWTGEEGVLNQHIFKVESNIDRRFHKYLLDYKLTELMRHTHGSGMVHITRSRFDNVPVMLPPAEEQRRIVEILEDHLSRVESGRSLIEKSQQRADRLAMAQARGLVTSHAGALMPFSDVFTVLSDGGIRVAQRDYLLDGPIPVVDQGAGLIGGYTLETNRFNGPSPVIIFGDHTRRVKFVDFPFAIGAQGVKILQPKPGIDPRYAFHLATQADITARGYGRHFALLRASSFRVPGIEVQRAIALEIDSAVIGASRLKDQLASTIARADALRSALLTAAFSGQLTRSHKDHPPLEELLDD